MGGRVVGRECKWGEGGRVSGRGGSEGKWEKVVGRVVGRKGKLGRV